MLRLIFHDFFLKELLNKVGETPVLLLSKLGGPWTRLKKAKYVTSLKNCSQIPAPSERCRKEDDH
jgi:hypothetical protein